MICKFFVHTLNMVLLYILLIAYILAINFYAFLLVKTLRDKERAATTVNEKSDDETHEEQTLQTQAPCDRANGKLCITGLLGGAITIYACMFIFKYKRSELLLMVLMPLLGVLNLYLWVVLFRSGFFILR